MARKHSGREVLSPNCFGVADKEYLQLQQTRTYPLYRFCVSLIPELVVSGKFVCVFCAVKILLLKFSFSFALLLFFLIPPKQELGGVQIQSLIVGKQPAKSFLFFLFLCQCSTSMRISVERKLLFFLFECEVILQGIQFQNCHLET